MLDQVHRLSGMSALGLVLLSGCLSAPKTPAGSPPLTEPMANVRLNESQVADVQVAFGQTLERRGEVESAIRAYEAAVVADPDRVDACVRLAVLTDQQGKFAESAEMYRRALERQPQNPDTYCNFGYSLYLKHLWDDAEDCLRQAIALKADHSRAHNNLGLVLARTGRTDEAREEFRKAGCTEADANTNLAYALTLNGSWAEAARLYEHALALQPNSAAARNGLANVKTLSARVHRHPTRQVVRSQPATESKGAEWSRSAITDYPDARASARTTEE